MTPRTYVNAAVNASGMTLLHIEGRSRRADLARYRMAAMALAYDAGWSSPQVGAAFGWRDHSTVLHAHRAWREGRLSREAAEIGAALRGAGA